MTDPDILPERWFITDEEDGVSWPVKVDLGSEVNAVGLEKL